VPSEKKQELAGLKFSADEYLDMEVKRLCSHAILPRRATDGSAGYDLFSSDAVTIGPGDLVCVPTGIAIRVPPGTYGRIAPRSGVTVKHNVHVGAGVIDADYTGEIKVVLCNNGRNPVDFKAFDRIAQLVLEKNEIAEVIEVQELSQTVRGSGGFGSTGN
jgi:dUTP pyrophosphatase